MGSAAPTNMKRFVPKSMTKKTAKTLNENTDVLCLVASTESSLLIGDCCGILNILNTGRISRERTRLLNQRIDNSF